MKKLLLLSAYVLATICTQSAAAQNQTKKDLKPAIIDSAVLPNSSPVAKKADGKGFTNLFEGTTDLELNTQGPRLNPQAISFVKDYIEDNGKDLSKMKDWALPYFNMMDQVLGDAGLPRELKYLAVIESRLKSTAV